MDNEISINELISIITEKYKINSVKIVDIDEDDILWKSTNDGYGVTYNIMTENIEIYFDGHKIGFISKHNLEKGYTEIDKYLYKDLLDQIYISASDDNIKSEVNKKLKKSVLFEKYEEAVLLKKFLDKL
jgi:hypothetical protein